MGGYSDSAAEARAAKMDKELEEKKAEERRKRQELQKDKLLAFQRARRGFSLAPEGEGDTLGG